MQRALAARGPARAAASSAPGSRISVARATPSNSFARPLSLARRRFPLESSKSRSISLINSSSSARSSSAARSLKPVDATLSASGGGSDDGKSSGGSGGNGGGGNGGDGGNGSNSSSGSGGTPPAEVGMLLAAGRALESLPPDLAAALTAGKVTKEILDRYLSLSANSLLAPLLRLPGFRERLLADPQFFVKVAIEVGIGIFTKSTAEYTKRGANFKSELDFVAANVLMALVADFMLVWLPAPTLSFAASSAAAKVKQGAVAKFLASCPENAFQKVPPGYAPFTVAQRSGAVLRNGAKLLGVGFGASLLGVSATNALIAARQFLDPSWAPPNAPQDVLAMSAAYASYMAVSSNLRYQVIAGVVEERGIEAVFKGNPALCSALSFVVRTGNTFLGSLMWVDYLRLIGLQKAPPGA